MKKLLLLGAGACLTCAIVVVHAQTPSLQDQINAVAQAQHQQEARRAKKRAEAEHRAHEARERAEHRAHEARKRAEARERAREARIEAARKKRAAAKAKIAAQNRQYVLEQRKLNIEAEKLRLKKQSTLVSRENDFINSKLKHQQAETNVVQSHADANRDVASGLKTLLQDKGQADVNQSLAGYTASDDHGSRPPKVGSKTDGTKKGAPKATASNSGTPGQPRSVSQAN